jgi:hypothetical protein
MCMRYHMHMLARRVQILLDEERYRKLEAEAHERRSSVASVIRDAIDRMPTTGERARRAAAIVAILESEPVSVPDDPRELRRELDEDGPRMSS